MTKEQTRWMRRSAQVFASIGHWVAPGGHGLLCWKLQLYSALLRLHRWLWCRGIEV